MIAPIERSKLEEYYYRRHMNDSHDQLVTEIVRLRKAYGTELQQTEDLICQALGLEEDPEYGYPTGDHITATLAAVLAGHIAKLREYCATLLVNSPNYEPAVIDILHIINRGLK